MAAGQEHVLGSWEGEGESVRNSVKSALYALVDMIERLDFNGREGVGKRNVGGSLDDEEVEDLKRLLKTLREIEEFYDCIGGIIGSVLVTLYLCLATLNYGSCNCDAVLFLKIQTLYGLMSIM